MLIKQQIKHFRALNKWFKTPLGLSISKRFCNELLSVNDILFGDSLLQLGSCGDNNWLNQLRFTHKWITSPFTIDAHNQIECSLNQLPLERSSIDCIFAPLTLEPFGSSLSLMDEIDRVLKPMGYVVFFCINPWSLWGAAMKSGLLKCYGTNHVKMRTPYTLNRTLIQRGYRQCALSAFGYIPPVNNATLINQFVFLDEVGKMIWPFPSGFYCYVAQKYEYISPNRILHLQARELPKEYPPLQPAL